MSTSREGWADLALHPVRIRILRAVAGGRRTTRELAEVLTDVPQATLYRQLAALTKGGLLEVAEERRVGGARERVYAPPSDAGAIATGDLSNASAEEHGRYFTSFVSSLMAEYARYLERERIDLVADGVGYQQVVLNLSDAEFARFAADFSALLMPLLGNPAGEGRTPRLLATVLMPLEPPTEP